MTKQRHIKTNKVKQKKRAKAKPPVIELVPNRTGLGSTIEDGTIQAQIATLADSRVQSTHQQTLAGQIGRMHGNQYLQRVVVSLKDGEKTTSAGSALQGSATELLIQRALTPEEIAENLRSAQLAGDPRLEAAFDNNPLMGIGEQRGAVKKIQQALIDDGFDMPISTAKTGSPDGIFGKETKKTVELFQAKYGLGVDGIVGRQTLGKMDDLYAGPTPVIPGDKNKPEIEATEEELGEHVVAGMDKVNLGPHAADKGVHYAHNYKRGYPDLWQDDYELGYADPTYFERLGFMDWRLKAGVSASEGIKVWLEGLTIAECLSAIYAIKIDAVRAAVGNKKFDDRFGSPDKVIPEAQRLRITVNSEEMSSADFFLKKTEAAGSGDPGTIGNRPVKAGEWYYFYNHPKYLLKHPGGAFQGENAIYMGEEGGDQIWSGMGVHRVTEVEMLEEMMGAYNLPRDEFDHAALERIKANNGGTLPPKYNPVSGEFPDQLASIDEILNAEEYEINNVKRKGGFLLKVGFTLDVDKIKKMREE